MQIFNIENTTFGLNDSELFLFFFKTDFDQYLEFKYYYYRSRNILNKFKLQF